MTINDNDLVTLVALGLGVSALITSWDIHLLTTYFELKGHFTVAQRTKIRLGYKRCWFMACTLNIALLVLLYGFVMRDASTSDMGKFTIALVFVYLVASYYAWFHVAPLRFAEQSSTPTKPKTPLIDAALAVGRASWFWVGWLILLIVGGSCLRSHATGVLAP